LIPTPLFLIRSFLFNVCEINGNVGIKKSAVALFISIIGRQINGSKLGRVAEIRVREFVDG